MSPIRAYRSRHGLTLQQFAEMVGVKRPAIWKYENGISPSLRTAVAIERATGGEIKAAELHAPEAPRPDLAQTEAA